MLDVNKIIEEKRIVIHYQPILSPEIDVAVGVEALARAYQPDTNELIYPGELIGEAVKQNLIIELEKVLIEEAMKHLKDVYLYDQKILLFLNVSNRFFEYAVETNFIGCMAQRYEISTENIILDIQLEEHMVLENMYNFVRFHREKGFYICLDDIGKGYTSLDMIIYLTPDVIKINAIALKKQTNIEYVENLILFLKSMCNNLGIISVAKNIETEEDLKIAMKHNVKLIQGYYISKPEELKSEVLSNIIKGFKHKISKYYESLKGEIENNRKLINKAIVVANQTKNLLRAYGLDISKETMSEILGQLSMVENLWFINDEGIQHLDTFINESKYNIRTSHMFGIYQAGGDYTDKEVYYQLKNSVLDVWVTKPFKSVLSNNDCICAAVIVEIDHEELIMCLNINYKELKLL